MYGLLNPRGSTSSEVGLQVCRYNIRYLFDYCSLIRGMQIGKAVQEMGVHFDESKGLKIGCCLQSVDQPRDMAWMDRESNCSRFLQASLKFPASYDRDNLDLMGLSKERARII